MKDSRTKNSIRNIVWGFFNKIINIILPFITRTALIYYIGLNYVGLNTLFVSVLGVLSLAELGFGTAIIYALYKPVAENDYSRINRILNFYRKCYRIIGVSILTLGLAIFPFIKYFINGDVPNDININVLYFIYLFNTVISYFLFSYKESILIANQRNDIKSNIYTILQFLQYSIQLILIICFRNYYVYIIVLPLTTIMINIVLSIYVNKNFKEIKCEGDLSSEEKRELFKNVKGMIFQKIGTVILNSVDSIVISAFLGLSILSIYSNYYLIITSLFGVLSVVISSIIPSVGNAVVSKSVEENYKDFKKFNLGYIWILSWFSICLLCLYQSFMKIWLKNDSFVVSNDIMILFVMYFYFFKWFDMNYVYQEAIGLWWDNRFIPLIASIINLIINLTLVKFIGVAGILISTIVSVVFVYDVGYVVVLFKKYFKISPKEYLIRQLYYLFIAVIVGILSYVLCEVVTFDIYISFVLKCIIVLVVPNILFLLFWNKLEDFNFIRELLEKIKKNGINKKNKKDN